MTESAIQKDILDFLNRQKDCFAFRVNNVGIFDPIKKIYRRPGKFAVRGMADVIGCLRGKIFVIEVKTPKGIVSEYQTAFLTKVVRCGGYAAVCRSLSDAEALYKRMIDAF